MNQPNSSLTVNVHVTNPGQFFACCGLLELAHRMLPGAEGWFDGGTFHIHAPTDDEYPIQHLVERLTRAGMEGELSSEERDELRKLESRKRALGKEHKNLTKNDEERRTSLGKRQREGAIAIGDPYKLRIAWWQEDGDDVPKTFAGRQEVLRMALAMLSELPKAAEENRPLDYRCLLTAREDAQEAGEGSRKGKQRDNSKVEPFYFDASRFAHALDAGFSLDAQEKTIRASAAPLTELFALIGLQRFRPRQTAEDKWVFEYCTWNQPIGVVAAAAVACGTVPVARRKRYRFRLQFRDDQKRYKAFGFATTVGGDT